MENEERNEMIVILHLRTGWKQTVFEKMSDEELQRVFVERTN